MIDSKVYIHLTCIYARKDAFIQQNLSSHLERLHLEGFLDGCRYMEVDEQGFAERRYTQEEREADIYLVLLSPHLLATPFYHSAYLKKILITHQYRQVKIIPLVLSDGNYGNNGLGRLPRLTSNRTPVKNENDVSLEASLTFIAEELKLEAIDWRDKKQQMVDRWLETQRQDKIKYYENFLKDFPHTIYREAAQKRHDELKEADLWTTAKVLDNVHNYYLYLRDAPLQGNRIEAIHRITEIELDEQIAANDALQSESLPMLFDYKVRFPKGKSREEISDKVNKLVKDRINHLDDPVYIQTEAHYLQYLAYEKLNKHELLSLRLLLDFAKGLIRFSKNAKNNIHNTQISLGVVGIFGVIFLANALPTLIRYAIDGTFGVKPFFTFIVGVLGAFLVVRAFMGYLIAGKDIEFCEVTTKALERSLVTIKISSIDHDQAAIFRETLSLLRIEAAYRRLSLINAWAYLFDRSTKSSFKQEEIIKKLPLPLKG